MAERNPERTDDSSQKKKYNYVNPEHYKGHGVETIDKMVRIWGVAAVALYCEITAFKYRDRIGRKPGEPVERELEKIRWYEEKAAELRKLIK